MAARRVLLSLWLRILIQYVPGPDTEQSGKSRNFGNAVYVTPYSNVVKQLIDEYGSNYEINDKDAGCSIVFTNPDISVAGHSVESLTFLFCYSEDESGYIIYEAEKSCFDSASYIIRETDCEQDYLDDYILGDNCIREDLYYKLIGIYGKQDTYYEKDNVTRDLQGTSCNIYK